MLVPYTGGYFVSGRTDCDKNNSLPGCNSSGYFYSGTPPKGSDNNFNPKEDFAESVAAYVYPTKAHADLLKILQTYHDNDLAHYQQVYADLYYSDYTQTARWKFINGLINPRVY